MVYSNRPEQMTALVAHGLSRYNTDIAALSKTRLGGTGDLADEPREAGDGFAIRTVLISKLEALPKGTNDRLMTMRIPLAGSTHLILISAYVPTMTYPEEDKEQFYQVLRDTLHSVPRNDKLLLMGDFNARTGGNSGAWPTVMEPHGLGRENANGLLRLTLCSESASPLPTPSSSSQKSTGSPGCTQRFKHWHLIDYVITRRRDIRDILITRAMRGATAGPTMCCLGPGQLFSWRVSTAVKPAA